MTSFTHRCRQVIPLVASFAAFGLAVISVWFFFFKPWPGVTASHDWTIIDPPAKVAYLPGDQLTWSKSSVCVPEGETTIQIFFVQKLPNDFGNLRKLAYTRIFELTRPDCREPNITSVMIPADLGPGDYSLQLRACTNTPSPIDTCTEVPGPRVYVRQAPLSTGQAR